MFRPVPAIVRLLSLHSRTDLVNTDTLSDENLMIAGIGRNM